MLIFAREHLQSKASTAKVEPAKSINNTLPNRWTAVDEAGAIVCSSLLCRMIEGLSKLRKKIKCGTIYVVDA